MRVLLTLVVCGPLVSLSHPLHKQSSKVKAKHGVGAPHRLNSAFLDRSKRLNGVEAAVRAQRLDEEEDMKTKELMAQIGKMEGELEEAQSENMHLNRRIAKAEVSFAQKEEKFQAQIFEFKHDQKIADDWVWRLEMGFIAQFLVALVLGLSCLLCHCQICQTPCGPCNGLKAVDKDSSMHPNVGWHRPMDPELKEKLRIRRMNLDGPPKQDGSLAGATADQQRSCAYYSLAEGDASEVEDTAQTPRSSAFPAVFSEPRTPTTVKPQQVPAGTAHAAGTEDWWGAGSPR
jgi:hypothetical protein